VLRGLAVALRVMPRDCASAAATRDHVVIAHGPRHERRADQAFASHRKEQSIGVAAFGGLPRRLVLQSILVKSHNTFTFRITVSIIILLNHNTMTPGGRHA
jgi:hypothetical protein